MESAHTRGKSKNFYGEVVSLTSFTATKLPFLKNPEDIKSSSIQNYLKEKEEVNVAFDKKGNLVAVKEVRETTSP